MTFLIIDDEVVVLKALQKAALLCDHQVYIANGGQKGLELWEEVNPDRIILDILMPDLTGPEVLRKAHARELAKNSTKVALISAYTGEYSKLTKKDIGFDVFIPKPFENIFEVIHQVERL